MLSIRRIEEDYEAKLRPPDGARSGKGKAEWERYGDGSIEFDARFRGVDIADGSKAELRLDGVILGYADVIGGVGRWRASTENGDDVPTVMSGQVVSIVRDGRILLSGTFVPD
jgi:hypothetical protein